MAGAADPWILERDKRTSFLERDKRTSFLVSGRREREETESRARTEFWRSFRYARWTRGDWVGDLFLICFLGVRTVVCAAIMRQLKILHGN